jgi:hypothetical protein
LDDEQVNMVRDKSFGKLFVLQKHIENDDEDDWEGIGIALGTYKKMGLGRVRGSG